MPGAIRPAYIRGSPPLRARRVETEGMRFYALYRRFRKRYPTSSPLEGGVALIFPILSRNRFGRLLEGIARGVRGKLHVVLSYPADEVAICLSTRALS